MMHKLFGVLFGLIIACLVIGTFFNQKHKAEQAQAQEKAAQEDLLLNLESRVERIEHFQLSILAAAQQYNEVALED